jgi:hypothetical protein
MKILQKVPLLPKIQQVHNPLSIILLSIVLLHMVFLQSLLLTLPLLFKIYQLNKLISNILRHMFILWNLLTLPLIFKIHQLNKLLSSVLLHMFILWSLLLTLPLLFKIHQLNKLLSNVLLHMFILWSLFLTLPLLFKFHQMLRRRRMPLWMKLAKILRPLDKFYDGLKNYKTKKLLKDLALIGMSVKEFWQHDDKDIHEFEYGKLLVPKHVHRKLS